MSSSHTKQPGKNTRLNEVANCDHSSRQVGGSHYKDFAIQPSEFIQKNKLGWCEGNAIKYVSRHRLKGTGKQDIEKAIHYLQLLLEWEYW